jgi:2'-5' RNA ligase
MSAPAANSLRLFYGLDLPAGLRRDLCRRAALRLPPAEWRVAHPDTLHVTLRFLGDTPVDRLPDLLAAGAEVAAAAVPFPYAFTSLVGLPDPRRARVAALAVGEGAEALGRLAASLNERLARLGVAPEGRAFRPHCTLARARDPARVPAAAVELAAVADTLVLWQSELGRPHAVYHPLGRWPLGRAAE